MSLTKRDLKARYKDSLLGFFWSLFRPAFLTVILWVVFGHMIRIEFKHPTVPYWMHVLVSVLTWNFFIGSLTDATHSLVNNGNLLKKVRLDSEVFPLASTAANALHFALAFVVVLVLLPILGIGIHPAILLLPFVIAIMTMLVLGLAFYLSALNVFYRDVGSALELLALAWFYVSPVFYPVQLARKAIVERYGATLFSLYMLNPVAPMLVAVRRVVLFGNESAEMPDVLLLQYLAVAAIISLLLVGTGWLFFRKLSYQFADEL